MTGTLLHGLGGIVLQIGVAILIAGAAWLVINKLGPQLLRLPLGTRVRWSKDPIPPSWAGIIERNVPLARTLDAAARERLMRLTQVFIRDHPIEGVQGFEVTEEVRVTIAAQASLLLLNLDPPRYPGLRRVLVYDQVFVPRKVQPATHNGIEMPAVPELGEAWRDGVVILSWAGTLTERHEHGEARNLVLHEFAHVLDHEDGASDGVPVLDSRGAYHAWGYVMKQQYERRVRMLHEGDDQSVLSDYSATNPAEFFAVATEAFFERPRQLRAESPDLYDELRKFYRQDPAEGPDARPTHS